MITERIKELCEEKGISVSELAEKFGVSRASVGKWSKSSPSSDTIAKIANYFGVSTDYFLGMSKYRYYVNPTNDSGSNNCGAILIPHIILDNQYRTQSTFKNERTYPEALFAAVSLFLCS